MCNKVVNKMKMLNYIIRKEDFMKLQNKFFEIVFEQIIDVNRLCTDCISVKTLIQILILTLIH